MSTAETIRKHREAFDALVDAGVVPIHYRIWMHIYDKHEANIMAEHPSPVENVAKVFRYSRRHTRHIIRKMGADE